jgi:hypothetical protein
VLRVVLEILGPGAPAPGGAARSGAPFDTVVSCCLLTQLQLVLVDALGDRHPAFELLRAAVSATHVRVLAGLVAPGGTALLCTDLASSETYPLLQGLPPDADLARLMSDLVHAGNIIYVAHPGLLSAEIRRDPGLSAELAVRFPIGPWLWQNGPELLFLVYALEITRKPAASGLPLPSATSAQEQT